LSEAAAMTLVVGRLRGRQHGSSGMGGEETSGGWHGSNGAEGRGRGHNTQGQDGASALGLGVGLGFRFSSSAFVYVVGLVRRGHLPVCVAYGHLSLSS
jgi:hypothetical protein